MEWFNASSVTGTVATNLGWFSPTPNVMPSIGGTLSISTDKAISFIGASFNSAEVAVQNSLSCRCGEAKLKAHVQRMTGRSINPFANKPDRLTLNLLCSRCDNPIALDIDLLEMSISETRD